MIIILFKKIISTTMALMITLGSSTIIANNNSTVNVFTTTASATSVNSNIKVETPKISLHGVHGNKIEIKVDNASSFKPGTTFKVYVSNKLSNTVGVTSVKNRKNIINVYNNIRYLKPSTVYSVKLVAVYKNTNSKESAVVRTKTKSKTYYNINKNTQLYTVKKGKLVKSSIVGSKQSVTGVLANSNGAELVGLSSKANTMSYIKITEGEYKGKYAKINSSGLKRISEEEYKRRVVSTYGASMNGGRYVWGGASFKATDCSGLTMQAYSKIGVNITHSVRVQASKGKSVSKNNMQPGDLIILNNYSHVAMYIGDNKMVHAMNSRDGIKVQSISKLQYYRINSIRRII